MPSVGPLASSWSEAGRRINRRRCAGIVDVRAAKNVREAGNRIEDPGECARTPNRKLHVVDALPNGETQQLLGFVAVDRADEDA